jgi:hypothetical protein
MEVDKILEPEGTHVQDYLFYYCICIPLLSSTISVILKFRDDLGDKTITGQLYFLFAIYAVNQIIFLVSLFYFSSLGNALTIVFGFMGVYYMTAQYYFVKKNDYEEPVFFKWANPIVMITTILIVILFAIFSDSVRGVEAWTICMGLIILLLSIVFVLMWLSDRSQH